MVHMIPFFLILFFQARLLNYLKISRFVSSFSPFLGSQPSIFLIIQELFTYGEYWANIIYTCVWHHVCAINLFVNNQNDISVHMSFFPYQKMNSKSCEEINFWICLYT